MHGGSHMNTRAGGKCVLWQSPVTGAAGHRCCRPPVSHNSSPARPTTRSALPNFVPKLLEHMAPSARAPSPSLSLAVALAALICLALALLRPGPEG